MRLSRAEATVAINWLQHCRGYLEYMVAKGEQASEQKASWDSILRHPNIVAKPSSGSSDSHDEELRSLFMFAAEA